MPELPYIYRWDRHDRKGQRCRVLARAMRRGGGGAPALAFGAYGRRVANQRLVEFADGFRLVTSGNALRRSAA